MVLEQWYSHGEEELGFYLIKLLGTNIEEYYCILDKVFMHNTSNTDNAKIKEKFNPALLK